MERKFKHRFYSIDNDIVIDSEIYLDINEIRDATTLEVLQENKPHIFPSAVLNSLLIETEEEGEYFTFEKSLGHDREIKRAFSALFGRFIARAYLTRYFSPSLFVPLDGQNSITIDGRMHLEVEKRDSDYDDPDWVVYNDNESSIMIAEAKGSHGRYPSQLNGTLDRAYKQTQSVVVTSRGVDLDVKRIAIATRWGVKDSPIDKPYLWVKDPDDKGKPLEEGEEKDAFFIGMLRHHIANLIEPLGYKELSDALRKLTHSPDSVEEAREIFDKARKRSGTLFGRRISRIMSDENIDNFIGGYFTDYRRIHRDSEDSAPFFMPNHIFVGVEKNIVLSAIYGHAGKIRDRSYDLRKRESPYSNYMGCWIIP